MKRRPDKTIVDLLYIYIYKLNHERAEQRTNWLIVTYKFQLNISCIPTKIYAPFYDVSFSTKQRERAIDTAKCIQILYPFLASVIIIFEWSNSLFIIDKPSHYWGPVELAGTALTALRVLPILDNENILSRPELLVFPVASPECVPLENASRLLVLSLIISFKPDIDWVCWSEPCGCQMKKSLLYNDI